ncbi:hypothetical protein SDC9_207214 [bioreactor metagenome]|uniref:Uncharacterized protein n=1 Tax=bioreactor metagenome TaxID=1076179 RepID=A0A645JIP3_9ZZZZ
MILQLQGHGLRRDGHAVDADDRPFLFTAGDQLRRLQFLEQSRGRNLGHHRFFDRRAATAAAAITATTSASSCHDALLNTSAARFDNDAPGTRLAR